MLIEIINFSEKVKVIFFILVECVIFSLISLDIINGIK